MYNPGDYVMVIDPTPYLDDGDFTNGLYFNDRMRVFIGRIFRVSKIQSDITYKLEYIDKQDCLEGSNDVITRWSWNEKWLALESEFNLDELECNELSDIMYMIEG